MRGCRQGQDHSVLARPEGRRRGSGVRVEGEGGGREGRPPRQQRVPGPRGAEALLRQALLRASDRRVRRAHERWRALVVRDGVARRADHGRGDRGRAASPARSADGPSGDDVRELLFGQEDDRRDGQDLRVAARRERQRHERHQPSGRAPQRQGGRPAAHGGRGGVHAGDGLLVEPFNKRGAERSVCECERVWSGRGKKAFKVEVHRRS